MLATEVLERGMVLVCRVGFQFLGKVYKTGDLFDYEKIDADWNRVKLLFDQRMLSMQPISKVTGAKPKPVEDVPVVEDVKVEKKTTKKKSSRRGK